MLDDDFNAPDLVAVLTVPIRNALPSNMSTLVTVTDSYATLKLQWRVICDEHYYNDCSVHCKAQSSDETGHYTCSEYGNKVCDPGWIGYNCAVG